MVDAAQHEEGGATTNSPVPLFTKGEASPAVMLMCPVSLLRLGCARINT